MDSDSSTIRILSSAVHLLLPPGICLTSSFWSKNVSIDRCSHSRGVRTIRNTNAIPAGIKIRGEIDKCLPTLEEAFNELKKIHMNVWVKDIWGNWKTIKMSDDRCVDKYTDVIWCNASGFETAYGYAYVNVWEKKMIHLSYTVFTTGDRGQSHENFVKDTVAVLLHETMHEQQWAEDEISLILTGIR